VLAGSPSPVAAAKPNQRCVCAAGPMMLQQVVGEALTKLIRKLRRYFPAGAP
jgi:hypothetical protein